MLFPLFFGMYVGFHACFSSIYLLFSALEDTEKELLVFAGSGSNPSEKFDFETNTTCILDSYPTNQGYNQLPYDPRKLILWS